MAIRFAIPCYPRSFVFYNDPAHPRHRFPEGWDNASHPRFAFDRIQAAFEGLLAKGYTVHIEAGTVRIRSVSGVTEFEMETSTEAELRAQLATVTRERDEALADGVLSQRGCDLENENVQLRADLLAKAAGK